MFVYFVKIRFQRKSKGAVWNSQSLQFHGGYRSVPRGCRGLIISLLIVGCWWNLQYLSAVILLLLFWQFVKIKWLNQINMLSCSLTSAFHVSRFLLFWTDSELGQSTGMTKESCPLKLWGSKKACWKVNSSLSYVVKDPTSIRADSTCGCGWESVSEGRCSSVEDIISWTSPNLEQSSLYSAMLSSETISCVVRSKWMTSSRLWWPLFLLGEEAFLTGFSCGDMWL